MGRVERYRRDARAPSKGAAEAEAARLMKYAAEHGTADPPATVPTFREFVTQQFTELQMPSYTAATAERYARIFHKESVLDVLGDKRLDEIDVRVVLELAAVVRKRGAVPRQHLIVVRVALKLAVKLGVLARMPDLPPTPRQAKKLPSAPSR